MRFMGSVPSGILRPANFWHQRHSEVQFMTSAGSIKELVEGSFGFLVESGILIFGHFQGMNLICDYALMLRLLG